MTLRGLEADAHQKKASISFKPHVVRFFFSKSTLHKSSFVFVITTLHKLRVGFRIYFSFNVFFFVYVYFRSLLFASYSRLNLSLESNKIFILITKRVAT